MAEDWDDPGSATYEEILSFEDDEGLAELQTAASAFLDLVERLLFEPRAAGAPRVWSHLRRLETKGLASRTWSDPTAPILGEQRSFLVHQQRQRVCV